jgi:hypothetical protein
VPQQDPLWAVADPCAVGGVWSEVGVVGWWWCDWLTVEGAVFSFDLRLHDGRHRFNLGLPERSWKRRGVDSMTIWYDLVLRALSMDLYWTGQRWRSGRRPILLTELRPLAFTMKDRAWPSMSMRPVLSPVFVHCLLGHPSLPPCWSPGWSMSACWWWTGCHLLLHHT